MVSIIQLVFSCVYLPVLFIIASYLFYKAVKVKVNNVILLSVSFYLNAIDYLLVILDAPHFVHSIITNLPLLFLLLFVKYTFYKDKKSAFKVVLFLFIIFIVLDLILRLENNFLIPPIETIPEKKIPIYYLFLVIAISNSIQINTWFFRASIKTYFLIKKENISSWVKQRYLIVSLAILCNIITYSLNLFIPPEGGWYLGSNIALTIALIKLPFLSVFLFGNLIGWVMPTTLKKYFNRNYVDIDEAEIGEEALLKTIKEQLSTKINKE